MNRIRKRFFRVQYAYPDVIDRQRADALLGMNWAIILATAVWLLVGALPALLQGQPVGLETLASPAFTLLLNLIIYGLIQSGNLRIATGLFIGFLVVLAILVTTFWNASGPGINGTSMIVITIPLVAAGTLLSRRGTLVVALIIVLTLIAGALSQGQNFTEVRLVPANQVFFDLAIIGLTVGLILFFLQVFAGNLQRLASESLRTAQQRQWIAELSVELGNIDDEKMIVNRALDALRANSRYVTCQIYLLDADMRLRHDQGGSLNRAGDTETTLRLNELGLISQVLRSKQPLTTSSQDTPERRSHLLPSARHGIVVPVLHGERILGVLDVQSAGLQPFSQAEARTLSLLAGEVGMALVHSRTVNSLRRSLREQEALTNRLQEQVADLQQRERRGISSTWNTYLQGRGQAAVGFDVAPDNTITPAGDVPDSLRATLQAGEVQVIQTGDERVVNVPIRFRDQTLGAMSFTIPANQEINQRQIEMAEVVAERLALALENTRLFEQSQAQVTRERKASQITGVLIGATDVSSVLNLAAENFNEALGAVRTRIYLQPGALSEPTAQKEDVAT